MPDELSDPTEPLGYQRSSQYGKPDLDAPFMGEDGRVRYSKRQRKALAAQAAQAVRLRRRGIPVDYLAQNIATGEIATYDRPTHDPDARRVGTLALTEFANLLKERAAQAAVPTQRPREARSRRAGRRAPPRGDPDSEPPLASSRALRGAIHVALEALEVGDQEHAVAVLLGALEDGPAKRPLTCPHCPWAGRWPGELDHHQRFAHPRRRDRGCGRGRRFEVRGGCEPERSRAG
jgi:hypothetical protein